MSKRKAKSRKIPASSSTLKRKMEELQARLEESEETLRAIREGEVDAVIVSGVKGEQIFSLMGTDSIYRLIVETMKEAAFTVTLEGKILFCNAQFGEFIKRPPEQIVGRPVLEFVSEVNRAVAASLVNIARVEPVRQRMVFQASDGSAIPAYISTNVLNQPDGQSICVVASDLSELENSTELIQQLRRQQEALQEVNEELSATEDELRGQNEELNASRAELDLTRARYQDLFETAPDGYIVTDSGGAIQDANQMAVRLLGLPADTLRGNLFSAFLPAGERDAYMQLLASIHAGTAPLPKWEVEIRPQEGPRFWAQVTASASRDEAGKIISLRWLVRDFTDRKRAEDALRESEERHRLLSETMLQGVVHQDAEGRIIAMNPAAERILGKTREQFMGSSSVREEHDTIRESGEPFPGVEHPAMVALRTFQTVRGVIMGVFNPKMGEYRWIKVDAVPISLSGNAGQWEVYTVFEDITQQKQSEEALREVRASLEVRVKERTAELERVLASLRESELRYRTLFETMDQGFCVVEMIYDPEDKPVDYRFVEINPAFEKHTGLQRAEGQTIRELVPSNETHWYDIYDKVARTGESVHFENVAAALQRAYDVFAFRIGKAEKPRVGILFKDITDRKRAEKELHESY